MKRNNSNVANYVAISWSAAIIPNKLKMWKQNKTNIFNIVYEINKIIANSSIILSLRPIDMLYIPMNYHYYLLLTIIRNFRILYKWYGHNDTVSVVILWLYKYTQNNTLVPNWMVDQSFLQWYLKLIRIRIRT